VPEVSIGATRTAVIRAASETFTFDTIAFDPVPAPFFTSITSFNPTIAQGPKGFGDLLIINIIENPGGSPPQSTAFIDVFVKLSDREG
jgi:hypothetical protein